MGHGEGKELESGWSRSFQCILFGVVVCVLETQRCVWVSGCVECSPFLPCPGPPGPLIVFRVAHIHTYTHSHPLGECVWTHGRTQDTGHARSRIRWFVNKSPKAQLRRHPPTPRHRSSSPTSHPWGWIPSTTHLPPRPFFPRHWLTLRHCPHTNTIAHGKVVLHTHMI